MNKNAILSGGAVRKVYDYRGRDVPVEQRRSGAAAVANIPGCRWVCQTPDLALISYPFVTGRHVPSHVVHITNLIRRVRELHETGVVHGDLRASNVVFGDSGQVTLIDFDFSGRAPGVKRYPPGFAASIDDGERSRSAREGLTLEFAHDWFAVGGIMRAVCECSQPGWEKAREKLQAAEPKAAEALAVLLPLAAEEIKSRKRQAESNSGG